MEMWPHVVADWDAAPSRHYSLRAENNWQPLPCASRVERLTIGNQRFSLILGVTLIHLKLEKNWIGRRFAVKLMAGSTLIGHFMASTRKQ